MIEKEPQQIDLSVLSSLAQMRGVQKELRQLVDKQIVEESGVREVLAKGLEGYTAGEAARRFADKANSLSQIIDLFDQGLVNIDQLLEAAQVGINQEEQKKGFLKKFLAKFGR